MADYEELYTTSAINTNGRNGKSYLTDGSFSVDIATPKEMGGSGKGTNPEQLFALGYSACFNSALDLVKRQAKIKDTALVRLTVHMYKAKTDADFKLSVDIEVGVENQSIEVAQALAEKTHHVCPYSKAVDGNIDVKLTGVTYESLADK
ncbi:MAG: organic hydroperoxide resistance protein [Aerococcus sp.]|nr:organic hydroperoxide resistance protein [Aerococcus sp.]